MRQVKKNRIVILAILFLLSISQLHAQQSFRYRAALPKVDSAGFYRINLTAEVVARCKEGLADLRLVGPDNKFRPFITSIDFPVKAVQSFAAFRKVPNRLKSDTLTAFIVEIPAKRSIGQLWLKLRNTAVRRNVNILGSDDLNQWYAIKEGIELEQSASSQNGNYEQLLTFPASTYRYIKIQVNNKNRTPVSILQAGVYAEQQLNPRYIPLPVPNFTQKDSMNVNYVSIHFPSVYLIDKLHLTLIGSKFYNRSVQVYQNSTQSHALLIDTLISSKGNQDLFLSCKTDNLELKINNGDNPALTLNAMDAFSKRQSVIAYLEKATAYALIFGNEKARMPDYDLNSFTDSIGRRLSKVGNLPVRLNPMYKKDLPKGGTLPSWIIWVAILSALLVLGLLTLKMTQEVDRKRSADTV